MKNLIFICLIFIYTSVSAQETKEETYTRKYQNYTSYALLIGSQKDDNTYIHAIQMDHNYLATKNFAVGLETGIQWMDINMATIGPNIKLILPCKNKQSLYTSVSYGSVIPLKKETDDWYTIKKTNGEHFLNTELGYTFPTRNCTAFFMALGYRYQAYSFTREDWWLNSVERKITYNRFVIKVGLKFN